MVLGNLLDSQIFLFPATYLFKAPWHLSFRQAQHPWDILTQLLSRLNMKHHYIGYGQSTSLTCLHCIPDLASFFAYHTESNNI